MSGLKVPELSMIERTFLAAVDWKLHIPEPLFKRWTDVVLRFTPSQLPPSLGQSTLSLDNKSAWKCIVPLLTPELDTLPMPTNVERTCPMKQEPGLASPTTPTPLHPKFEEASRSQETTPTPFSVPPRFLEPRPEVAPPTPALVGLGFLPTPQMTPSSVASSTPAAKARSLPFHNGSIPHLPPAVIGTFRLANKIQPRIHGFGLHSFFSFFARVVHLVGIHHFD
ncbi:PHO85 cyclin-5 [Taxawa tesnikishii (nom. ined.)]|nr:PHO85 cyclin-5 [Dothideales sp. JES 119]